VTQRTSGHLRRIAFGWAGGLAVALSIALAFVVLTSVVLGDALEHAAWLGVFVGVPLGAFVGGLLGGRMAGAAVPTLAWAVLNPGASICGFVLAQQASQHGVESEYFLELLAPSAFVVVLSFAGAVWGRKSIHSRSRKHTAGSSAKDLPNA
jgi:Na+-transporting NADH:ubiquinone oxidoreductase subunit NqrD